MIKLGVLGALVVTRDGRDVTLPTPMLRRLLALLLSQAGTPISADAIADALWAGRPPRTARKTLAVYVHRLRRLLDADERIGSGPAGYWITAGPGELDSLAFEQLAARAGNDGRLADQALALFRGRPYEEFLDIEPIARVAEVLTERRLALLEQRIQIDLDSGRHAELIGELHAVVAEHPYRERFRGQLMLALYRAGRQADALEAYRQAHRVLAEELGVEPVPEIKELHQRILRADPALSYYLVRDAAPRLLPRDVPDFTGRDADLRWLDGVADTPGSMAVITAIAGTAGVGKTALAVHWALRAADRFPGGQLYVNLRGYSPGAPLTPLEALGMLLRALGTPPEGVPDTEDEAAALYRSTLVDRQTLVLLDNAHSADQVRPLLPGGRHNLVLVTSRDRLGGLIARDGARRLTLDTLSDAESLGLLRRVLGAERVDADFHAALDVVCACGRLPLALRVAAARLADEPGLTLRAFADVLLGDDRIRTLEVDGDPQGAVRAIFGLSVERLDPQALVLFRRIGLLPVSEAGAYVADLLMDGDTSELLGRLADASLIVLNKGHFQVHDLVHAYARDLAEPEDVEALLRCYEALVRLVLAADETIPARQFPAPDPPSGEGKAEIGDPEAWLHSERDLVLRAAGDAARRGWDDPAWKLVAGTANFAGRQKYINEWLRAGEEMVARIRDGYGIAVLRLGIGGMLRSRGEPLPAVPLLRRARRAFVRYADSRRAGTAATQLSMAYRVMGATRSAMAAVAWAIERLEPGPVVPQLGTAHLALGNLLVGTEDYAGARVAFERAAEVMRACDDRAGLANVLTGLGLAMHGDGLPSARALVPLAEAVEILSGLDDPVGQCMVHCGIASIHLGAGELAQAQAHGDLALDLARNSQHAHGMRVALRVTGETALAAGDAHTAVERFEAAIVAARKTGALQPLERLNDLLNRARAATAPVAT